MSLIDYAYTILEPTTDKDEREAFAVALTAIGRIKGELNDYLLDNDSNNSDSKILAVGEQLSSANWSSLSHIQSGLPFWSRGKFKKFRIHLISRLAELNNSLTEGKLDNAAVWQSTLDTLSNDLQQWQDSAIRSRRLRRILIFCGAVLVFLAGPLFVVYQFMRGGIESESISIVFPVGSRVTISETTDVPTLRVPEDRQSFMAEFSRFYFGHPSAFAIENLEEPATGGTSVPGAIPTFNELDTNYDSNEILSKRQLHRWKIVLQNTSVRREVYVSSARAQVELLEELSFPWHELSCDPALTLNSNPIVNYSKPEQVQNSLVQIKNEGIGPAFGLTWKITAGEQEVGKGEGWIIAGNKTKYIDMWSGSDQWFFRFGADHHPRANDRNEGPFIADLYYELTSPVPAIDEKDIETIEQLDRMRKYVLSNGKIYEKIWTAKRLNEITKFIRPEKLKLLVNFEDMQGKTSQLVHTADFPAQHLFCKIVDGLQQDHPLSDGGGMGSGASELLLAMAAAFSPPVTSDAHRQLIGSISLDLSHISRTRTHAQRHHFDAWLAPGGRITLYTTATGMRSGKYSVAVDTNDVTVTSFNLEVLAPDRLRFPNYPPDQWQAIKDFRFASNIAIEADPHPQLNASGLTEYQFLKLVQLVEQELYLQNYPNQFNPAPWSPMPANPNPN